MLFICYKMKILEMMIVTGIFCQRIGGEHHKSKNKRQIIPSLHNEGVADYNSLQHLNENQIFQERYPYHDGETVGIFPFGLMRGAARHFTRRIKTRAHLHHHHPHLLEPTPDHLLHEDENMEEKETDRHEEFNPMLQSPQLYHEETSPNVLQPPTPHPVVVNRIDDRYQPQTTGKIICNFYDPEEMVYKPPHSSEQDESHIVGNPFQGRHFYEKGYIYGLISKHLRKHPKQPSDDGSQAYGQTTQPISSIKGEKITINQNFQISQIAGNNNGVSQAQQSNQHNSNIAPNDLTAHAHENQNYQKSQIHGTYNAVSQSQTSHQKNLNSMQDDFNDFFNNQNDQMSQIYGSNNAVQQSQESNHHQTNNDFYPSEDQYSNTPDDSFLKIHDNENFQGSQIYGSNNAVNQEQSSHHGNIVGAPYVVHFDQVRPYYPPKRSSEKFIHPIKRSKRQLKIWNLITDPNSHLDVSRTIENVGHAARSAMEDEKHPNFHIKNAVGSAKNAIMSTMKIIPQDFIIPSEYKIIGKSDEQGSPQQSNRKDARSGHRAMNPNLLEKSRASPKFLYEKFDNVPNEEQFVQTYAKVGSMVRDSVRSSKETLNHIGNVYSNARKAVAAARHSVPKMLTRSMRIPEVRRNFQRKPLERVGSRNDLQDNFVGASEMMNSFGFLTPKPQRVNWKRNAVAQNLTMPDKYVVETMQVLNDARKVVGANSINEFLVEMEKKYNSVYENKMKERHSNRQLRVEAQQQSLDTRNTFDVLKSLTVDDHDDVLGSSPDVKNSTVNNGKLENLNDETEYFNEKSRISMTMGKKLVTPYMGKLKHVKTEPYYDNDEDIEFYK